MIYFKTVYNDACLPSHAVACIMCSRMSQLHIRCFQGVECNCKIWWQLRQHDICSATQFSSHIYVEHRRVIQIPFIMSYILNICRCILVIFGVYNSYDCNVAIVVVLVMLDEWYHNCERTRLWRKWNIKRVS